MAFLERVSLHRGVVVKRGSRFSYFSSLQIQSILEGAEAMEGEGSVLSSDPDELVALIDETESKIGTLQGQVAEEVVKMDKYKVSNCLECYISTEYLVIFKNLAWLTFGLAKAARIVYSIFFTKHLFLSTTCSWRISEENTITCR